MSTTQEKLKVLNINKVSDLSDEYVDFLYKKFYKPPTIHSKNVVKKRLS